MAQDHKHAIPVIERFVVVQYEVDVGDAALSTGILRARWCRARVVAVRAPPIREVADSATRPVTVGASGDRVPDDRPLPLADVARTVTIHGSITVTLLPT